MPNHVSTILKLSGDSKQIKKFIADIKVKGKEEYDFDLLLPVPVELQNTTSPTRIVSEAEYQQAVAKAEAAKEAFKRGEIRQIELEFSLQLPITQAMSDDFKNRFGFDNWYEWRLKNYGTKWGMYNVEFDGVDGFTKCDGNHEALLERRNWIKLLKTLSEEDSFFYYARDMEGRVTGKQRKAILRWCEKNNKKLPGFLREFS